MLRKSALVFCLASRQSSEGSAQVNRDAHWGEPGVGHSSNRRPTLGIAFVRLVAACRSCSTARSSTIRASIWPALNSERTVLMHSRVVVSTCALTLPSAANAIASSILARADDRASDRDPLETTSKIGVGNAQEADRQARPFLSCRSCSATKKRPGHGRGQHAVRAPPVALVSAAASGDRASTATSAPVGFSASLSYDVERGHAALKPWRTGSRKTRPPTPEIATHSPGLAPFPSSPCRSSRRRRMNHTGVIDIRQLGRRSLVRDHIFGEARRSCQPVLC